MTRGEQSAVRNAMNDLSAKFWEGECNEAMQKALPQLKGSPTKYMQTIVQPIQLWSIVVPKENISQLQQTIFTNDFHRYHAKGGTGKPYKRDSAAVFALRKMLRAKKCPPIPENTNYRIIRKEGVEFLPIGIKEDPHTSGFEGL